jgi:hypothetical protein
VTRRRASRQKFPQKCTKRSKTPKTSDYLFIFNDLRKAQSKLTPTLPPTSPSNMREIARERKGAPFWDALPSQL